MSSINPTTSTTGSTGTTSATTPTTSSSSASGAVSSQPFQVFGIASGLDTNAIITKLLAVYSQPMTLLQNNEASIVQQQSAWNDIQNQMNTLQTAITNLQAPAAISGSIGTTIPPSTVGAVSALSVTTSSTAAKGTFTVNVQQLASNAILNSSSGISKTITSALATSSPLAATGFGIVPTNGTFTVNGVQMTVDSSTTLLGGVGTNSIQQKLAGAGVTLTTTGGANVTGITLTAAGPIQIGAAFDTSNVLNVLRLTSSIGIGTSTVASNGSLSGITLGTALSSASFRTTPAVSGSFTVNGASISYTTGDTLGSILAKINGSTANVTATYDALSDKLVLAANTTGGGAINVADVTGNLAAALNINGVASTGGQPAIFKVSTINGGALIANASNTVTGIVPGVTLNLTGVSASMGTSDATTVTVSPDNTALTTALQGFVTAYNAVQDTANKYGGINLDQTGKTSTVGILAGDPNLSSLGAQLDRIVNGTAVTISGKKYSMASLGITTGVVGSYSAGTAPSMNLVFDSTKATSALSSTPTLAQSFVGNGSISSQSGTMFQNLYNTVKQWTTPLGRVSTSLDALTANYANDEVQIRDWQTRIQAQRSIMVTQFSAMESSLAALQAQSQALTSSLSTSNSTNSSTSSTSH